MGRPPFPASHLLVFQAACHIEPARLGLPWKPAPVYLVAGRTRTFKHGAPPDWVLELVPPRYGPLSRLRVLKWPDWRKRQQVITVASCD